jgi:hypothetical protein
MYHHTQLVLSFFLFTGCHSMNNLCHMFSLPLYSASPQDKSNGVGWPWTETSETMNQNKFFLLKLFSSDILSQQWKCNESSRWSKREQDGSGNVFYDLSSDILSCLSILSYQLLYYTGQPLSMWEYQKWEIIGKWLLHSFLESNGNYQNWKGQDQVEGLQVGCPGTRNTTNSNFSIQTHGKHRILLR